MRKFFLISVFLPVCLSAQVSEDFSDGDFTMNPSWHGDVSHFKISYSSAVPENQRPALQLDAPEAGTSSLAVSEHFAGDLEWQFWVKLSLNTSSGNYARVYLLSDTVDLKAPLDGYFLQIGGTEDSVIFYRQDSLYLMRLVRLNSAFTGNSVNAMRFRVTRSQEGNWKFYADSLGGQSYEFQGEFNDLNIPGGDHFGISCQYTSSNLTKFYFDDFYAGPMIIDSISPSLNAVYAAGPSEISLAFSEPVEQASAEDTSHYSLIPDLGLPYSAIRLLDPTRVELFFGRDMESGINYELSVSSIQDLSGNETGLITRPVWYYLVRPYDVVFSEIMADPIPPTGLPEYEYLEILNRSLFPLDLAGWKLAIISTYYELPAFTINPGNFLLIADNEAAQALQPYGDVIALETFILPNNGASLQLMDTTGNTICFLQYDQSWYKDDLKADGGWSLEMTDPANPCIDAENWAASVDPSGGTPGRANSIVAAENDGMKIIKTCCLNEGEIEITFNESLDTLIASEPGRYLAEPFLGFPDRAIPVLPEFTTVKLLFSQSISTGQIYQLSVNPGLKNCIGEEIPFALQSTFALPEAAEPYDIIINEVLFNPGGDGVDYVEIYNRSVKAIDLSGLIIASLKDSQSGTDTQSVSISLTCTVILPSCYLLLTSDPQKVKSQYYTADPEAFLEIPSFPSYNNDKGYVLLMDRGRSVIDGMSYTEDMHFLMLNSREGVSLERICPDRLGDDRSNWHSAAETAGFGTPGYQNSQYLQINNDGTTFTLQPEVFSPDGDGRDDNLGIVYNFDSPGKLISVMIFNTEGRLAKTIVDNEMPGTRGTYTWDGTLDDRTEAQNGIYIVYMEALGMDGKTRHYKQACVLARQR